MKRSDELTPLSHDHHQALVVAMRLRRADDADAAGAAEALMTYWREDGQRHFREEEELLLPAFAAHGDLAEPLVARALLDHVSIRAQAQAIERSLPDPDVAALRRIGEDLAAHIRIEERELFPLIEATLPADVLARLGAALAHD